MIKYIEGDLFDSPAQVLVNTVNTVGVMGKGIALEFKKRYPEMFRVYRDVCEKKKLRPGFLMLFYEPDHWVLLFPTKEHWRNPSKIEYIEAGLYKFCRTYAEKGITSVAFPKLGCGNGELSWSDVQPVMEKYLKDLPIDVFIYLGTGEYPVPEHKKQKKMTGWLRQNALDMSFQGIEDDIRHECAFLPLVFDSNGSRWNLTWSEGLNFEDSASGSSLKVGEESFYDIWSEFRGAGIAVQPDECVPKRLVYDLLLTLGYCTKINITDVRGEHKQAGYQLNAGKGRTFALKGTSDGV